jgi:hypothetical protein
VIVRISFPSPELANDFIHRLDHFFGSDVEAFSSGVYVEMEFDDSEEMKRDMLQAAKLIGGTEVVTRLQ